MVVVGFVFRCVSILSEPCHLWHDFARRQESSAEQATNPSHNRIPCPLHVARRHKD